MPYITPSSRTFKNNNESYSLDDIIKITIESLIRSENPTDQEILSLAGDLNYLVSNIMAGCIKKPSYKKIAIITGVLENIKQEFYRRVAEPYEDKKIQDNGDIIPYLNQI